MLPAFQEITTEQLTYQGFLVFWLPWLLKLPKKIWTLKTYWKECKYCSMMSDGSATGLVEEK